MWAMTSFGILMPAIRPPHTVAFGDDRTMQIRARRARELDILRAKYMPGKLGPNLHTPDKDYEYRAYCTPEAFALAMARMVTEIDYLKFKPTTDRYADNDLHSCYNRIWSVVLNELSTDKHRFEYWHSQSGTVHTSSSKKPTSKGIKLTKAGSLVNPLDDPTQLGWPYTSAGYGNGTGSYSTAADRDNYLPDPSLEWDEDDAVAAAKVTGIPEVDALYDEVDVLLEAQRLDAAIDHSQCDHASNHNARARCKRRIRRATEDRLQELWNLIDAAYHEAKSDQAAIAAKETAYAEEVVLPDEVLASIAASA